MQPREYRAEALPPRLAAAILAIMLLGFVGILLADPSPWLVAAYALAVVAFTVQFVQSWRWRLTTDDAGITVHSGLGSRSRVRWQDMDAIRRWPPAVKPRSRRPIRLPLLPRTLRELDERASRVQGRPDASLLQGSVRLNPARAYWVGSVKRFLLVVAIAVLTALPLGVLADGIARMSAAATGVDYGILRWGAALWVPVYFALLVYARTLRGIVVVVLAFTLVLMGASAALWVAGFQPADVAG